MGIDFIQAQVPIKLYLPPTYSSRLRVGILQYTHDLLLKFNTQLNGIPVAINKISLTDPCAVVKYDNPYFHISIIADMTIWRLSTPNQLVTGKLNKISGDHVGLLVFEFFNALIPASALRKKYFFDAFSKKWIKIDTFSDSCDDPLLESSQAAKALEVGQVFSFFLDRLEFISQTEISFIGSLSPTVNQ